MCGYAVAIQQLWVLKICPQQRYDLKEPRIKVIVKDHIYVLPVLV